MLEDGIDITVGDPNNNLAERVLSAKNLRSRRKYEPPHLLSDAEEDSAHTLFENTCKALSYLTNLIRNASYAAQAIQQ